MLPLLFQVFLIAGILSACAADRLENSPQARGGRQDDSVISGGIDFSGCVTDPDTGLCCVDKACGEGVQWSGGGGVPDCV